MRNNFFAGETFVDLADVRARAETWCAETAGMRVHGTAQCRPIEEFRAEELLLRVPDATFDVPIQSAKTSRLCWMKNVWSCPLFGSSLLYVVFVTPSGTASSV